MGFGSRVGSIDCGDGEEEDAVNLAERASAIVLAMQDEKWQAQEERILRALSEVYREGFMDGEASVNNALKADIEALDREVIEGCAF
jgi:hypothetical protein